jgi:predicted Zn-dependent protease
MKPVSLFSLVFVLVLASFEIAQAEHVDWKAQKTKLQKIKHPMTSKVTAKRIDKAFSYSKREKYSHAIEVLVDLLKQTKGRNDESAMIWQQLGFVLAQKGDNEKAIKALENSLSFQVLPYQQTLSSYFTVAQLYFASEKYQLAEDRMMAFMNLAEEPSAEAYILTGSILSQNNKKEEALKFINQAIISSTKPQEKWLQFALALNHELKKYENAIKILVTLTSSFPTNDKYWKQLSTTYLSLNQDTKALATLELAYKLGHIKLESDIMNLASLYVYLDLPLKGAELLQKEISAQRVRKNPKSLDLLSQAHMMAKNKALAIVALEDGAQIAAHGDLEAKLGFLHFDDENWKLAEEKLNASLKKSSVKNPEKVYMALAMIKYNQKDFSGALEKLYKARKIDEKNQNIHQLIEQIKMDQVASNESQTGDKVANI